MECYDSAPGTGRPAAGLVEVMTSRTHIVDGNGEIPNHGDQHSCVI